MTEVILAEPQSAVLLGNYLQSDEFQAVQFECTYNKKELPIDSFKSAWNKAYVQGWISGTAEPRIVDKGDFYSIQEPAQLTVKGLSIFGESRGFGLDLLKKVCSKPLARSNNFAMFGGKIVVQQTVTQVQMIEVFQEIIERIDQSGASESEKEDAKGKLAAFLKHPLVNTILGGVFGALL